MNLLFVVDSVLGHATPRVRGGVYRPLFEAQGWTVEFADAARDPDATILARARSASVVYLLKVGSLSLIRRLRAATRAPLVFDLTDPLWLPHLRAAGWHDIDRILRVVDAVICENDHVAGHARRFNEAVFVLPTCAQTELFEAARERALARSVEDRGGHDGREGRVRVGWVGSRSTAGALEKVREPLRRVCARHPEVELRVVGCRPEDAARILEGIPHSVRAEYDEAGMIEEMLALDVGLFPAPLDAEDYRARGALKALLYLAAGAAVLCQEGGDCSRLFRDGEEALLASGEVEWEAKLEALVSDPALRARLARAGRERARRDHSLARVQGLTRDALLETIRRRQVGPRRNRPSLRVRASERLGSLRFRLVGLWASVRRKLA